MENKDLKTSYSNQTLRPIYAGTSAIATISQDGSILATPVLDDIEIIKLSPLQERLTTITNNDEQEITCLKLTPDGKFLISIALQSQALKIYNLTAIEGETTMNTKQQSLQPIKTLKLSSPSYIMDCDSTSTLVAVGGTDGSIIVVDIENGFITHSFKGHGGTISSVKFYGNNDTNCWLLCSGDTNGMVKIWDLVKRSCIHTLQEHNSAVRGLDVRSVSKENDNVVLQLLSGSRDNIVNLWEFNLRKLCKLLKTLPVNQQVESCGFIHDHDNELQDIIYTAGGEAIFQLISLSKGSVIKRTVKPTEELFIIGTLPFTATNNDLNSYIVMSDQTLQMINLTKALSPTELSNPIIEIESCIAGNHGTIADMKFVGQDLNKLALATNSPTLRIIPVPSTMKEAADPNTQDNSADLPINMETYEGHTDLLNSLAATEDGQWLATASKDHTSILWKYSSETSRFFAYAKFIGHSSSVTAVGLPNVLLRGYPEFLITASNDLTIKKWKIPTPSKERSDDESKDKTHIIKVSEYTRHAHDKDINSISISPNDSLIATGSYDKSCKLWNLDSGELVATLNNHKRGIWDVSFCQFDKLIATCSGDKTIKLWSLDTFAVLKTFAGHTNAVQRCTFINKQKQLVSSGADGLIKIWDCTTGDCLKTLDGHDNRIWALTTWNDGELIVSADADGVLQFWNDCTELEILQNLENEKEKVENEQSLKNFLLNEDWTNAFLLALTLDHPMRLFNVLKQSLLSLQEQEEGADGKIIIFNKELDKIIGKLSNDQLILLLKRCRDWNTNARTHTIAQRTIRCILLQYNIVQLSEIPGLVQIIESIIPYTQRHFDRVDNLVEQSYVLDYALVEMDKLF
ncbi:U3 snoRNA-associated protein UTP13 NDAI_0E03440 [Naumovozyma dairenensis CBS 421]|uniref:U3 small nucleolar RNA-associated protein 13 C-terminal domain-containing protein n=1 Tax=Naumovozyma dairenensis (strain ATCC 10597 / BCRC 20456 / CBS 421 / NBRC 0211 / NRRL Y-12639) TaxID=1071378 RepID=G0WBP1_NAUDC|nr:hypothetical protein NDAI_0E03440 [Naumovozyma dairenensis CBS 421]CCD25161.1 hypothetical protein NDAI_0E03440 [Naumovozyma dairenensis CBS 421]